MKKILSIVVSMVMIFAFTAVSIAAEQEAAPAKAPAEKTEKVEKKHHAKRAVHYGRFVGEVSAVDAAAGTITVKHRKGEVTVTVEAKTRIRTGKEKKSITDVKTGEKVTVRYKKEEGKDVATSVYIWKARKAAKKVEKKTEKKETASAGK